MACQDNYIQLNRSNTARSGLYASDLPGVEIALLEALEKGEQNGYLEVWDMVYSRAWENMVSDISKALQSKFHVDVKLLSRETSKYQDDYNSGTGLAGVRISYSLPKYARIHILSVSVFSEQDYPSPSPTLYFYEEDEDGELLHQQSDNIEAGRNTINVDRDFEVDKLFIAYNKGDFSLKKTENKYFPAEWNYWDKVTCTIPCYWGGEGEVRQIEGGGLNVKYSIVCSIEKYVCENLNFFRTAFWYRIGLELTVERRMGNRLTEYNTMTDERYNELFNFYNSQYQQELANATGQVNIHEDPFCFNCKNTVTSRSLIP